MAEGCLSYAAGGGKAGRLAAAGGSVRVTASSKRAGSAAGLVHRQVIPGFWFARAAACQLSPALPDAIETGRCVKNTLLRPVFFRKQQIQWCVRKAWRRLADQCLGLSQRIGLRPVDWLGPSTRSVDFRPNFRTQRERAGSSRLGLT